MPPTLAEYLELRPRFAVTRELAQGALVWAQPLAMEALGIHTRRQTLVEGELPAYVVMTTPETNGGWGELMPVWFKPYERPVPLDCLARIAYRESPIANRGPLTRCDKRYAISDRRRFLRHGALPILLAILWLELEARDAWLAMHACGARRFAAENDLDRAEHLAEYLEHVEEDAWLVAERERVAGEAAVGAFLADASRARQYAMLFGGLCLGISAVAAEYGGNWRQWIFQTLNVAYRLPEFGLAQMAAWLSRK